MNRDISLKSVQVVTGSRAGVGYVYRIVSEDRVVISYLSLHTLRISLRHFYVEVISQLWLFGRPKSVKELNKSQR